MKKPKVKSIKGEEEISFCIITDTDYGLYLQQTSGANSFDEFKELCLSTCRFCEKRKEEISFCAGHLVQLVEKKCFG